MKMVIAGGTGFIGSSLTEKLRSRGDEVLILTRKRTLSEKGSVKNNQLTPPLQTASGQAIWNPESASPIKEIDGADAVINLAGEPIVGRRWTAKQKQKILESRINSARLIANSIKQAAKRPKVLINASAIGFYGSRGNEILTETSQAERGFLAETCKAWEAHAIRCEDFNVRVVRLRIGIVLDKTGGALKLMLPAFRIGVGGWLGGGNQWMSWITREDLVNLIIFCLEHEGVKGAVNAVSPQPVTNKTFSMVLAQVLKRPCFAPVPEFMIKFLLGEASEVLLGSQRVRPQKAIDNGFLFQHADIRQAFESILS